MLIDEYCRLILFMVSTNSDSDCFSSDDNRFANSVIRNIIIANLNSHLSLKKKEKRAH